MLDKTNLALLCILCLLALFAVAASGCAKFGPTDVQVAAMGQAYAQFAAQPRMGEVIHVTSTNGLPARVTIEGEEITVATPLPPLQALPPVGDRQWDAVEHAFTELSRLGMFGTGAYLLKDAVKK